MKKGKHIIHYTNGLNRQSVAKVLRSLEDAYDWIETQVDKHMKNYQITSLDSFVPKPQSLEGGYSNVNATFL